MRRRPWWVLTTLGLALVGCLIVAFALPRDPPFDFLEGQVPLTTPLIEATASSLELDGMVLEVYSFQTDVKSFLDRAHKELTSKGLELSGPGGDPEELNYSTPIFASAKPPPAGAPESRPPFQSVALVTNHRYEDRPVRYDVKPSHTDKGWITVSVTGEPQKTLFHRFRKWVGF